MQETKPLKVQEPKEEKRRKRVYTAVAVIERDGVYGVSLDGRPLHTPGRSKLESESKALLEAIATEWDAQQDFIDPATMPQTKLLNTALDRIAPDTAKVVEGLMSYVDADLLCYRAHTPESLIERQAAVWQPILNYLSAKHGIELKVCAGLMPETQQGATVSAIAAVLSAFDVMELTAHQAVASLTGSLALGLALVDEHLSGSEVAAAAYLDETWQMEQWGEDKEALVRKRQLEGEILSVERFLSLTKQA